MISRGSVCWVDLGPAQGSKPAKRRPVLVVQSDEYNASRLNTIVAVVLTSNTNQSAVAGNVFVPAAASGLSKDSAANVSAVVTLDKTDLDPPICRLPSYLMDEVDAGLRLVLDL